MNLNFTITKPYNHQVMFLMFLTPVHGKDVAWVAVLGALLALATTSHQSVHEVRLFSSSKFRFNTEVYNLCLLSSYMREYMFVLYDICVSSI
jgi:hypothetical protein